MKRYVRSSNKIKNFLTQQAAKKFDENEVLVKALLGKHKGDPMMYVFFNIMLDPNVQIEDPDRLSGPHTIFLNGKNVGWLDFEKGVGNIDDRAYDKIQKQDPAVLSQLFEESFGQLMDARVPGFADMRRGGRQDFNPDYNTLAIDDGSYGDDDDLGGYY